MKSGKTTWGSKLPQVLILAFERGTDAISGTKVQPIDKWLTFKNVVKQLAKPEAKEMYKNIVIDTATWAYQLCEDWVCAQHGVANVSDVAFGALYKKTEQEFSKVMRAISQMNYGLLFLAHSEKRTETIDKKGEVEFIAPLLDKRAYKVINQMVDIIAYISTEFDEKEVAHRFLYTRETPRIVAGSRWKYLESKIPFGYDTLVDALNRAIDLEIKLDGAQVAEGKVIHEQNERTFEDIQTEAREIWQKYCVDNQENASAVLQITEQLFGQPTRLGEITPLHKEVFEEVVAEMRKLFPE